jgi:hypothetical protein
MLPGHTALVVDDGIATGSTGRAACRVARAQGAARVVLAVPVCSPETARALRAEVDELVCLETPRWFSAVGQFYTDFRQTSDGEVTTLLQQAFMPPSNTSYLPVRRSCRTGTSRSRAARTDGPTSRSEVPATIWVPPPAAVGDRWRTWLLTAIDRAFLPAHGHHNDLTAHLATDLHGRHPHGHGDAIAPEHPMPATPYWAALIRDQPTPAAPAATGITPPVDPAAATGPAPTGPAASDPTRTGLATAGEAGLADLAFVDLAGAVADDRLGILANRALRGGGVLAVLTHCHHSSDNADQIRRSHRRDGDAAAGEDNNDGDSNDGDIGDSDGGAAAGGRATLVDPTGSVVASAQNADLLYLQHIVIPTHPLTHPETTNAAPTHLADAEGVGVDPAAADPAVTDHPVVSVETVAPPLHQHLLPRRARHRIAHVDLLVFARPVGLSAVTRPAAAPHPPHAGAGAPTAGLVATGRAWSAHQGVRL